MGEVHTHNVENITDSQSSGTREEKRLCVNSYVCFNGKYRSAIPLCVEYLTIYRYCLHLSTVSMTRLEPWMSIDWRKSLERNTMFVILPLLIKILLRVVFFPNLCSE